MSGEPREFRIVLCRRKFSASIGSVCRAMKTMGLTQLAIVGDPETEDRAAALATAVHAADVYETAMRAATLPEAVADCTRHNSSDDPAEPHAYTPLSRPKRVDARTSRMRSS